MGKKKQKREREMWTDRAKAMADNPYVAPSFPEPYPEPEPMTEAEWRGVARMVIMLSRLA